MSQPSDSKKRKLGCSSDAPPHKKQKQSISKPPDQLSNLATFAIEEDLIQSDHFLSFKGNFGDRNKPAILKIRPSKPNASELKALIKKMELVSAGKFGKGFGFYKAKCVATKSFTKSFNVDVIYPWIESENETKEDSEQKRQRLKDQKKMFDKFYERNVPKQSYIVRETPEMYAKITAPYIQSIPMRNIEWVYDILEGKRESERIVINDCDKEFGYVTLPDSKWKSHPNVQMIPKSEWKLNESIAKSLYLICMVRDRGIKSLRDLRGKHVRLLENLMNGSVKGIEEVYGMRKNKLRIFVHYPPQYWHFHIHFASIGIDYGINAAKAILLEDIIDNLKMNSDYYKKANLSCVVLEGDKLLQ